MLGQSKNKFDAKQNNQQMSVILKRTPQTKQHVNLILNQPMEQSVKMQDTIVQDCCLFTVQKERGYYHLSSQVCLKNSSSIPSKIDFIQFGICDKEKMDSQCKEHMRSNICNITCDPNYIMSDTLSCIMFLECDVQYTLWLNIGSDNAGNFLFE